MKVFNLLILILWTSFSFGEEYSLAPSKEEYVGSTLKDVLLEDEKLDLAKGGDQDSYQHISLSALYSFYTLSASNQLNSFSSDVASDFSPGFEIDYRYNIFELVSLGTRLRYQKVIFQTADVNTLRDNARDTFLVSAYAQRAFLNLLKMKLETGFESNLYLESISDGVADLKTIQRPYGTIYLSSKLKDKVAGHDLVLSLELGYKQSLEKEIENKVIESSGAYIIGVKAEKAINHNDYGLSIQYQSSEFKVDNVEQKFAALSLQLSISFGGSK